MSSTLNSKTNYKGLKKLINSQEEYVRGILRYDMFKNNEEGEFWINDFLPSKKKEIKALGKKHKVDTIFNSSEKRDNFLKLISPEEGVPMYLEEKDWLHYFQKGVKYKWLPDSEGEGQIVTCIIGPKPQNFKHFIYEGNVVIKDSKNNIVRTKALFLTRIITSLQEEDFFS